MKRMTRSSRWLIPLALAACLLAPLSAARAETPIVTDAVPAARCIDAGGERVLTFPAKLTAAGTYQISLTHKFTVDQPPAAVSLDLRATADLALDKVAWKLNGGAIAIPVEGMRYTRIPAIDPSLLRAGENEITAEATIVLPAPKPGQSAPAPVVLDPRIGLVAMRAGDLKFQTAPALGHAGTDYFTLACRTNMAAAVTLEVDGRTFNSPAGLMHRFRVDGLKPATAYEYKLSASLPGSDVSHAARSGPFTVRTFPDSGGFSFVVMGDSRTNAKTWGAIAKAALEQRPAFIMLTGDMAVDGRNDWMWDEQYFRPAAPLLASTPCYPAMGNHEQGSALWPYMMLTPEGKQNWTQRIGPMQMVAIDGRGDWQPQSANYQWLEGVLAKSDAPFLFVSTHYPAWSSGRHGQETQGQPNEPTVRAARNHIMPLLARHRVTAFLAGHEHLYERSDPGDAGVVQIVTGGAGAPLYPKVENARTQNPHSKAFASEHHFCLFQIDADACSMKAINLDGKTLDESRWPPRGNSPSPTTRPQ